MHRGSFHNSRQISRYDYRPFDGSQRILPEGLHRYCQHDRRRISRCGASQKAENQFFRDQNQLAASRSHCDMTDNHHPIGLCGDRRVCGKRCNRPAHRETFCPANGTWRNLYFYARHLTRNW